MDINYHYFAIKTLARFAGFAEEDAQVVAANSQMIDDFDLFNYMILDSVPEFAQRYARKVPGLNYWFFNPVTTGFSSLIDFAHLGLDRYQRRIAIPFHFIPQTTLNVPQPTRAGWRTVPAHMNVVTLMQAQMTDAIQKYLQSSGQRVDTMRVGMLLHTFADTYAHQSFSGFHGWENHARLMQVVDNATQQNITASYEPEKYFLFPSIGHANVNHAPDDSNVSFAIHEQTQEGGEYSLHYQRSNTDEYKTASREILNILRACKQQKPIDDQAWNTFTAKLTQGFLTSQKDVNALCAHWDAIFPDYNYHYRKEDLLNECFALADTKDNASSLSAEAFHTIFAEKRLGIEVPRLTVLDKKESIDFFWFNVLAGEMRDAVNGQLMLDEEFEFFVQEYSEKSQRSF